MLKLHSISEYDSLNNACNHVVHVLIKLESPPLPLDVPRKPLNISLVLDRSASMEGRKIQYTKLAADFLCQRLSKDDTLSIIAYDHEATVLCPPTPGHRKDVFRKALKNLYPRGFTNLSAGWHFGLGFVERGLSENSISRTILLTDGQANQGLKTPEALGRLGRSYRAKGVSTTTLGFGSDFNEDLLTHIAEESGGHFYYIDNPDRAPSVFLEELGELSAVIGQNLEVVLHCEDGVSLEQNYSRFPGSTDDRFTVWRLGDVYADDMRLLVVSLKVPIDYAPNKIKKPIAHIGLRYHDANLSQEIRLEESVEIDFGEVTSEANPEVIKERLLLQTARAKEKAVNQADSGDFGTATLTLTKSARFLRESLSSSLSQLSEADQQMVRNEVGMCDELIDGIENDGYGSDMRKAMKTQIFNTKSQRGSYRRSQE